MKETLVIHNLSHHYGKKKALDDVSLAIGKGMYGLLGRNGAGKTTLMKHIATLLPVKSGTIELMDAPLKSDAASREQIGYLPQTFSMYASMTAHEALDYLAVLSGLDAATRKKRIPHVLEQVNLTQSRHVKVKAMSGGMKRRLGIAQAILHDPKVIVVDEPTAGLDPEERVRLKSLLATLSKDKIVLLSTHIASDIEAICDHVGILDAGQLIFDGALTALIAEAQDKLYKFDIPFSEREAFSQKHRILSMTPTETGLTARFVSETHPFKGALPVTPTVEDAYLYKLMTAGGAYVPVY